MRVNILIRALIYTCLFPSFPDSGVPKNPVGGSYARRSTEEKCMRCLACVARKICVELFGLCVKRRAANDSCANTLLKGNAPTGLRSGLIGIALVSTVTPIHLHSAPRLPRCPEHAGCIFCFKKEKSALSRLRDESSTPSFTLKFAHCCVVAPLNVRMTDFESP